VERVKNYLCWLSILSYLPFVENAHRSFDLLSFAFCKLWTASKSFQRVKEDRDNLIIFLFILLWCNNLTSFCKQSKIIREMKQEKNEKVLKNMSFISRRISRCFSDTKIILLLWVLQKMVKLVVSFWLLCELWAYHRYEVCVFLTWYTLLQSFAYTLW